MNGVSQFLRVVLALTLIGGGLRVTGAVTSCVNDHLVEEDQSRFVAVEPQIPGEAHPLSASSFEATDIGHFAWDRSLGSGHLEFDGETAVWANSKAPGQGFRPPWVGASTLARLHRCTFRWDFEIDHMQSGQISVGFMLMFEEGVDWGFYGYLGSGEYAWAYDPSTGDVVNSTVSIAGGLPTFANGQSGTVTVEAELPRHALGRVRFIVDGRASPDIELPVGAVITPAASFIIESQRIRIAELVRSD